MRLPLYAAGIATGGAFEVLFSGGALPYVLGAALVGIFAGSAGAYRFVLLFPAAFLYTLVAVYGALPLRLSGWRTLLERAGQDIYEAAQISYVTPVPYDLHPGLLVVLIPIIVLVVAFATSVTLYEGSPIVSVAVLGLTIGVLSTVSFEVGVAPFFALFLVSGVALLLFARDGGVGRGEWARPAAVLAGVLVLLLVLALPQTPLAEEAIRPALIDWTRIGTGGTSRLAVEADVGDYLTEGRNAELLRIRSTEPMLWRGGTLDYFDGVKWSSTVEPGEDDGEEISAGVETHEVEQAVEVLEAETNLLFGGYKISRVSVPDADERSDGSWASDLPLVENSSYRVRSQIPQPTTYQLEAAGADYPEAVREKFLQLPDDRPEVLSETAQNIQTDYGPRTPYDTARAIERYLLYDGGFTYDLDADYGRGDRAIEQFLGENRRGFCTQFATSMALLSRELGVPSRVVYGATTGKRVAPDEYVVTGHNMHTWVEVYFPGVGWYTFDPTRGFSVPRVMEANAPRPDVPGELSYVSPEDLENLQAPGPAPGAEGTPVEAGSVKPAEESSAWPRYAIPAILVLVLLAAVPLLKRLLTARGRPEDLYRDLAGRLRDVLPLSGANTIVDSPALTPTERLVLLARTAGIEAGLFREFAQAYSESLYASHEPRSNVSRAYRRALREYERLPRWKRALGAVNPASLFLRARRRLAAHKVRLWKVLHSKIEGLKRFRGER